MNKSQKGTSPVVILLLVLLVAIIGGTGWYVYYANKNSNKTLNEANSTQFTQPAKGATKKSAIATQTDPYAGWKTYTDTQRHYTFKYPATWTLETTDAQVTVLNPSKSLEVDYIAPYTHDSGLLSFDPVSINSLSVTGLSVKLVGGVYAPANEPDYGVVDTTLLSTYPLTIGTPTQFPNALRFTDTHVGSSSSVTFRARATDSLSSTEAHAWFDTDDAKTALLILESLSYKQ